MSSDLTPMAPGIDDGGDEEGQPIATRSRSTVSPAISVSSGQTPSLQFKNTWSYNFSSPEAEASFQLEAFLSSVVLQVVCLFMFIVLRVFYAAEYAALDLTSAVGVVFTTVQVVQCVLYLVVALVVASVIREMRRRTTLFPSVGSPPDSGDSPGHSRTVTSAFSPFASPDRASSRPVKSTQSSGAKNPPHLEFLAPVQAEPLGLAREPAQLGGPLNEGVIMRDGEEISVIGSGISVQSATDGRSEGEGPSKPSGGGTFIVLREPSPVKQPADGAADLQGPESVMSSDSRPRGVSGVSGAETGDVGRSASGRAPSEVTPHAGDVGLASVHVTGWRWSLVRAVGNGWWAWIFCYLALCQVGGLH